MTRKDQTDYMREYLQWCVQNPTRRVTFYGWMILQDYAPHAENSTLVQVASVSEPMQADE